MARLNKTKICIFDTIVTMTMEMVVETKNEHKIASPHATVSKCLLDVLNTVNTIKPLSLHPNHMSTK